MTNGRKIYMNGKFIKESDAKISIFDSALMFGDMVFEMTRSFNKEHFKLKEHIDRLFRISYYKKFASDQILYTAFRTIRRSAQ